MVFGLVKEKRIHEKLIKKPWGAFETLAENENVTVKIIWVDKGKKNSLQTHENVFVNCFSYPYLPKLF